MNTEKQTDKATARPWKLAAGVIGPDKIWREDENQNETLVARGIENEYDAALIVRAVNEYAALVAVAEAVENAKEVIRCAGRNHRIAASERAEQILNQALASLAAAREGKGQS